MPDDILRVKDDAAVELLKASSLNGRIILYSILLSSGAVSNTPLMIEHYMTQQSLKLVLYGLFCLR